MCKDLSALDDHLVIEDDSHYLLKKILEELII